MCKVPEARGHTSKSGHKRRPRMQKLGKVAEDEARKTGLSHMQEFAPHPK